MTSLISADNNWALFAIMACIAALAIYLEQHFNWAAKVSGCVLALIGAMILSNLGVIPTEAEAYDFVWDYVVPLAIPMLLFNANIRKIGRESGRLLIIFLLSGIGTIVGGFLAYYALRGQIDNLAYAVPMMIGTYTGGSVNLVAMADAYGAPADLISTSVVADNLLMAIYFFVLVAVPASKFFLSKFSHPLVDEVQKEGSGRGTVASYWKAKPVSLMDVAVDFALSFAIVAVSSSLAAVFSDVIPTSNFGWTLLSGLLGNKYLLITTITMALATAFPRVGELGGAQEIGTYLIHIFFAVIGVPASLYLILTRAPLLLVFCLIIVGMNMLFSFVPGWLFHFNLEEIIIASNANVGGPTTAAAMAIAKGWNELIVPAILVGTLGYVLGNYYGVFAGTVIGLR